MDAPHAWIRLTKTGVSANRLNRLLDRFGSPEALFDASARQVAEAARSSLQVAEKLLDPMYAAHPRDLKLMEQLGVRLVPRSDPEYPALLKEISDPPPALYVRGTLDPRDRKAVAIVGSRVVSKYALKMADQFGGELAQAGVTVVSGLARGTDTAAHQGTLRGGGRTLACLGCGVDVAYPYENKDLANLIARNGALVSEYPMTAPPDAWHFPRRNRIISGLSLGVVVVEAPKGSGALITADCAVDQNREVFAIPGNIDQRGSRGPHSLIKDGAKLVETVEDILSELRLNEIQPRLDLEVEAPPPELSPDEAVLFHLLSDEPLAVDDLIHESGFPASKVGGMMVTLEMKDLVRRLPGNAYVRRR